jgi:hypothetical protein
LKSYLGVIIIVALVAGCRQAVPRPGGQAGSSQPAPVDLGAPLLKAAAAQLNDLPASVDTVVRPPSVVLDSRKSSDGKDVLATCTANPAQPDGPFNVLTVPAGNAHFRSLRVRPGDIVKYYILPDKTLDQESELVAISQLLPIELTVAQVSGDDTLLLAETLPMPINFPQKLEIWRYLDDRLVEISEKLRIYAERRLPVLGWEPSPDKQALKQIVDQLNQWLRQSNVDSAWQAAPTLETLDDALRKDARLAPFISPKSLGAAEFESYDDPQMRDAVYDGRLLQEAIWLRDISRWALGEKFDDLGRAEALFDWTVRNIQLDADEEAAPRRPWQVLLHGRGTARERAWVFALLCRQQGLDVVILTPAAAHASAAAATESGPPAAPFALAAVLTGGQLHVFDPQLGLPIRGPDGTSVATLEQLRADDSLLRRLDLPDMPYAVKSEQLRQATVNIVADPFDLTRAAFQLDRKLTGENRVVLSTSPAAVAERLKSVPGLGDVQLWDLPFTTLRNALNMGASARLKEAMAFEPFAWRPRLWKARVLHFQGKRRPAGDARSATADETTDHAEATRLYSSKEVRPSPRDFAKSTGDKRRIDSAAQLNAAYWVGLLLFDDQRYDVAAQWLDRPELLASDSPWAAGARYNLARTKEALGEPEEAIKLYEADTSWQGHGSRLRAKWLKARRETQAEK